MRAACCTGYGPPEVVEVRECPISTLKAGEVLVRVKATSLTAADYRIRGLNVPAGFKTLLRLSTGFRRPRNPILGIDFSGVVEELSENVDTLRVGQAVFGTNGIKLGCHAEYLAIQADKAILPKPDNLSFEEAAVFPFGAMAALYFLRDQAKLEEGQSILVYGASGAVGLASVQLAKLMGAQATGVCSTRNAGLVRSHGADQVLDYEAEGFSLGKERFDVVFDAVGKTRFEAALTAIKRGGIYVRAVAGLPDYLRVLRYNLFGSRKVKAGIAGDKREDLETLSRWLSEGKLVPHIDRSFDLDSIAEAHRYSEGGHKRGNVLVRVS